MSKEYEIRVMVEAIFCVDAENCWSNDICDRIIGEFERIEVKR